MDSKIEKLLNATIDGETIEFNPQSRMEEYLKNCVNKTGTDGLPTPQSRVDALLYKLAETIGSGFDSLEERVFGKEVEWRKEESTFIDGLPFSLPKFEGLEAKKYIFTHDTADKSVYQVFDLTGMTVGETRNNGSVYDQGMLINEYFLELFATMEEDGTVTVETNLYFGDSIGDIFGDQYGEPIYCTEYFEPCLEERVTALEKASGGNGGGSGDYTDWTEITPQTVDYLSEGFILNAQEGTSLFVKFEDIYEVDWWNEFSVTVQDGYDSGGVTVFDGNIIHACVARVEDYDGGVFALYFTDDYGEKYYIGKSVYVIKVEI